MSRPLFVQTAKAILGALILLLAARFFWGYRHDISRIRLVDPAAFAILVLLTCAFVFNASLMLKFALARFGIAPAFKHWFGIAVVGGMLNYLLPFSPGLFAKAGFMKKKFNLSLSCFSAIQAAIALFCALTAAVVGLASLVPMRYSGEDRSVGHVVVFLALWVVMPVILVSVPLPKIAGPSIIAAAVKRALEGFALIRTDAKLRILLPLMALGNIAVSSLLFLVSCHALHVPCTLFSIVLLASIANLSNMVLVTPGNLGVSELAIGFGGLLNGVPMSDGLPVAILCRAANIAVTFGLGFSFGVVLWKDLWRDPRRGSDGPGGALSRAESHCLGEE